MICNKIKQIANEIYFGIPFGCRHGIEPYAGDMKVRFYNSVGNWTVSFAFDPNEFEGRDVGFLADLARHKMNRDLEDATGHKQFFGATSYDRRN